MSDTPRMKHALRIYSSEDALTRDFAVMTADGWIVRHITETSNSSGGIHQWTVIWARPTLSAAALAYLAASPDPAIAAEASDYLLLHAAT